MTYSKVRWVWMVCIAGVFVVVGVLIVLNVWKGERSGGTNIDESVHYPVTYVLDGDTFQVKIKGRHITVRMLGIDTPESVDPRKPVQCFGKEASEETKHLLVGHSVILKLNPKREVRDKYGRYLAYVYRDDGIFINEYLLENGFAKEFTFGRPYTLQKEFVEIERGAKRLGKGLWKKCAY